MSRVCEITGKRPAVGNRVGDDGLEAQRECRGERLGHDSRMLSVFATDIDRDDP